MSRREFTERITRFLKHKKPFFFIVDFDRNQSLAYTFTEALKKGIFFNINGTTNDANHYFHEASGPVPIEVEPFPFKSYLKEFETVMQHLNAGNSFLVNLTFPSKIISPIDLKLIYNQSKAGYKLLFQDRFVCFSPESFIKIRKGHIYSYPMKGTIDALIEGAADRLLNDPKEQQEHNTIVDLIRNDLSMVARKVTVTKFRYLDKITTANGEILQTSSEIRGELKENWEANFGELLLNMLPAGSISGAPKPKTVEIIKDVENYDRGFYTGVFGIFDGKEIDSGVAIRFIEKKNGQFWYKSGGGITHQSNVKEEYIELIKKIYIPTV